PDLPWPHGFTLRGGGVSGGAYASLNLGLSSGDAPEAVEANRDRLLAALGYGRDDVCAFHQVHGRRVLDGTPGWFVEQADAATSATPGRLLVVSVADCLPLLFVDPVRGAVGAAHCGWRGTVQGLAGEVVRAMSQRYGSRPADLRVAIGPGIQGPCYQVGPGVRPQRVWSAAACTHCEPDRFYSHRRDAGVTGRHWAFIGVPRA
ncbi:MAG: polyphenol oxidase family protein, partial [Deinococcales bacterium]